MIRVVFDTNVWISALLFPGRVCDQLLHRLRQLRVEVCISEDILDEIRGVLREKFDYSASEADAVIREIRLTAQLVIPTVRVSAVATDEADNRVLECALAARASSIVTGDTKDLLPLKQFSGIPIESPRHVLNRVS